MIATLDRLYALHRRIEDTRMRIVTNSVMTDEVSPDLFPLMVSRNDLALLSRLTGEHLQEAEEVAAEIGKLQDYE